jgi:hypothetical protein
VSQKQRAHRRVVRERRNSHVMSISIHFPQPEKKKQNPQVAAAKCAPDPPNDEFIDKKNKE